MPIPKTKNTAPGAKGKASSANGSAAPTSVGEKKDTSEVVLLPGGKPDKQAHEKEQERIKVEIDALHVKLVSQSRELRSVARLIYLSECCPGED